MHNFLGKLLVVFIVLFSQQSMEAQRLGNILKQASKDIGSGVTDKLADKLADKITEIAIDKISAKLDSIFQEAYEADTTGTNSERTYQDFLTGMDESDKVGDSYSFVLAAKMLVVDAKGKETYSTQHYSEDGNTFGIETDEMFIVFDATNRIMVTYNLEEKTGFAFGQKLMKYSAKMIPDNMIPNYEFQASAGTKNILGYSCSKYLGQSDDGNFEVYVADDFPISMKNAYEAIGKSFYGDRWSESYEELNGVALESIYTEKNGDVIHSTVVEVKEDGFTLDNSAFTFGAN